MSDVREIYSLLLARGYSERLFSSLPGERKREGRETLVTCPFCQKERHFSYSSEKPLWRCWACEEAGDWIGYLEKRDKKDFTEALRFLAKEAGIEFAGADRADYQAYTKKGNILEAAQEHFRKALEEGMITDRKDTPEGKVFWYLFHRGYQIDEMREMELGAYGDQETLKTKLTYQGYTVQDMKEAGLLNRAFGDTHTLAFLWRDKAGRATGLVCRSLLSDVELKAKGLQKYMNSYGMEKAQGLAGFVRARGSELVLVVEGHLDAHYLNLKGVPTVGIGGKESLKPEQIHALESTGTKELLLCLDSDPPGRDATERMLKGLSTSKLRAYVVSLPSGFKDPDELVRERGIEALQEALKRAENAAKWRTRYLCSRFDLQADRGRDQAIEEALKLYTALEDAIDRRDCLEVVKASLGLSEEDLAGRLQEQQEKATARQQGQLLQHLTRRLQERASEGDLAGAETILEEGLQSFRRSRGVDLPEPYLLEALVSDLLNTSEGLKTGLDSLDRIFTLPQGAITIIAGRPGHGKTSLLLNLLLNLVRMYPDWKFYFFSYEEARKFLGLKLVMILAGEVLSESYNQGAYLNYFQEKRGQNKAIEQAISTYETYVSSGRLVLSDRMLPAEDLAATLNTLSSRGEIGAVLVDYIQKVPLSKPLQGPRYLDIKRVSELLLEQAIGQDIPLLMGAQFNRQAGEEPKLSDLRESGDIEQDANLVLGLYNESVEAREKGDRPDSERTVDLMISVLKHRGGIAGKREVLTFDRPILKIKDKDFTGKVRVW